MNHTPGPWGIREYKSEYDGKMLTEIIDKKGKWVLTKENAHLISAAPELLEALKAILAYEDDRPGPGTFGHELYQRAQQAILKTEGRSNEHEN